LKALTKHAADKHTYTDADIAKKNTPFLQGFQVLMEATRNIISYVVSGQAVS